MGMRNVSKRQPDQRVENSSTTPMGLPTFQNEKILNRKFFCEMDSRFVHGHWRKNEYKDKFQYEQMQPVVLFTKLIAS